ncbi:UNVERIFIED_CONTAM: hypothetical protein Sradi_3804100 [Sesamum radiatum]|uniref:Reverse transcriptase domain-containing protein n=1 Tax=Sesamum radiatum TaxID=300843 RepID=A0AAW2Q071_SESRA
MDDTIKFQVLEDDEQFLHLRLQVPFIEEPLLCTVVYGKCDKVDRGRIWEFMRTVGEQNAPWMIGGDFNLVVSVSEQSNGAYPTHHSIEEFNKAIFDCGLSDVGFEGRKYTWTNYRLWQRLDRILSEWMDKLPSTSIRYLPRSSSDHCPLLVQEDDVTSSGMAKLAEKLKRVKQRLKQWNKDVFGDIFSNVKAAEEVMTRAERTYDVDPTDLNLMEMNRCTALYQQSLSIEEDYWRQKAAVKWSLEGDRRMANGSTIIADSLDVILSILDPMHATDLCKDPTLEEVRRVIFDMASDSIVGPDGFNARFYQACWEVVKFDILEAIEDFLKDTPLPLSFTAMSIVLILKVKNPSQWNEFRPISLCNTTNKLLTKLLNDRLKPLLPSLIVPNQMGSEGVSHLAYADDFLIFTNAKESSFQSIMAFLTNFEHVTRQRLNVVKSSFTVSLNAPLLVKCRVKRITRFVLKTLPFTYLGAPIYVGPKRGSDTAGMIAKSILLGLNGADIPVNFFHERVNYYWVNGKWDIQKLQHVVPPHLLQCIILIPFYEMATDRPAWKGSATGEFTIKSTYD